MLRLRSNTRDQRLRDQSEHQRMSLSLISGVDYVKEYKSKEYKSKSC